MFFKLKPGCGNHSETGPDGKPVVYTQGDVIESDHDLEAMFAGKFERVQVGDVKDADPDPEEDPTLPPPPPPSTEPVENPLGKDRTEKFPKAAEEDFMVFYKRGKGFSVVEADEPTVPLNEDPLKKDEVADFIDEYLKS